jgi:hypothetical protein
MLTPIYTFTYTLNNTSTRILGTGRFRQPERSKMWRHLKQMLDEREDVTSIGYEKQK